MPISSRTAITHDGQDIIRGIPQEIHSSTRHELHMRLHRLLQQQQQNLTLVLSDYVLLVTKTTCRDIVIWLLVEKLHFIR